MRRFPWRCVPVPNGGRTHLWSLLAYTLRFYRQQRGASLSQTAARLSVSRYTVSHWEAGRCKPDVEYCQKLDQAWSTGGLLELIHFYARTAHDPDWFGEYARFEARATMIRIFQCSTIPGLLQTAAYARMVLFESGAPDVEDHVARRMARQQILTEDKPPNLAIILDERVLDTAPLGRPLIALRRSFSRPGRPGRCCYRTGHSC